MNTLPPPSSTRLALAALSVALLTLALSGWKPGLPPTLKADEPAYYLAAESLVHDFDLKVEAADRLRLFESFPYLAAQNLIVMSDDGWNSLFFGKPYIYSLCAAPFVAIGGADGMLFFNMLLFVGMIWMGYRWLRQFEDEGLAALFAVGFLLASSSFVYVFWLHPEVFNMFAAFACLYWGLGVAAQSDPPKIRPMGFGQRQTLLALVASAAVLAAGTYNKPMLAAMGVPVCIALLRRRRWGHLLVWLLAAAISIGVLAGISIAFTGKPTAYLVDLRAGFPVHDPYAAPVVPIRPPPPSPAAGEAGGAAETLEKKVQQGAGWWWILRLPDIRGFELAEDLRYFFFGRHTGLFVYQPFAFLALILLVLYNRSRIEAWAVLGSVGLVGAFFLIMIPFNWHGGGGFVGNRYLVMVVPSLLFCVGRIGRPWPLVLAYAAAGLTVGPLILAPHGLVVPQGTLQAHVRNAPFRWLPMEHSLGEIPGYHGQVQEGLWIWGRKDQLRPVGEEIWVAPAGTGGVPEIWIQSDAPLRRIEIELSSPVADNGTRVTLGSNVQTVVLGTQPTSLVFEPQEIFGDNRASQVRRERRRDDSTRFLDLWLYRLEIEARRGELPRWSGRPGPVFDQAVAMRVLSVERSGAETAGSEMPPTGRGPSEDGPLPDPSKDSRLAENFGAHNSLISQESRAAEDMPQ